MYILIQEYFMKILSETEYSSDTTTETEMVYHIKVKRYHSVPDNDTKLNFADMKKTYRTTDDNIITDEHERFRRQEVLFQTSLSRGNETFQQSSGCSAG